MSKTRTIIQVDSKDGESYEQLQLTAREVDLMGETQVFPKVRELYIGKDVTDIKIKNGTFPNIRKVVSDSDHYPSTNNGLLIRHGVLQNTFHRGSEEVLNFAKVARIGTNAMQGCGTIQIIEASHVKYADKEAFAGSAFLDPENLKDGLCRCGSVVANMDEQAETICLPASIRSIDGNCKKKRYKKLVLENLSLYPEVILEEIAELEADIIHFLDLTYEALSRFRYHVRDCLQHGAKRFEVSGMTNMEAQDGILYAKGGKVLALCPAEKAGVVKVPEGVAFICPFAFYKCHQLTELILPNLVTDISYSFVECTSLKKITFGTGLTKIGQMAFSRCGLEEVTIPEWVTDIGENAFSSCAQLHTITLEKGMKTLERYAFSSCRAVRKLIIKTSSLRLGENSLSPVLELRLPPEPPAVEELAKLLALATEMYRVDVTGFPEPDFASVAVTIPDQKEIEGKDATFYLPRYLDGAAQQATGAVLQIYHGKGTEMMENSYLWTTWTESRQETAYRIYQETKNQKAFRYLKRVGYAMFLRMLQDGRDESQLVRFLEADILSRAKLPAALNAVQEKGLPVAAAYLLQKIQQQQTKPSKQFGL